MSIRRVDHTDGKPVLLNTETGEYFRFPDLTGKDFFQGSKIRMFDDAGSFLSSESETCIIPCFCIKKEKVNRRIKAMILSGQDTYEIFNVERHGDKWQPNDIEQMQKNKAYFIICRKNKMAINEFMVERAKEIQRSADTRT